MKNVKSFLGFLGDRLGDKPMKINMKVGDKVKEVTIEAKSQRELQEVERIAKDLIFYLLVRCFPLIPR